MIREMFSEFQLVTPERAETILKEKANNRAVDPLHIKKLARAILKGTFNTHNPHGLSFGINGRLIDGEHRVRAIVMAGVPVNLYVHRNVPDDVREILDFDAKPRNVRGQLKITRNVNTNNSTVSAAKIIEFGESAVRVARSISQLEGIECYDKHSALIAEIDSAFGPSHSSAFHNAGPVRGALGRIAHLFREKKPDVLAFCRLLSSGLPEEPRDAVVILLRDYLMLRNKQLAGGGARIEVYRKTQRAFQAFEKRESLQLLKATIYDIYG